MRNRRCQMRGLECATQFGANMVEVESEQSTMRSHVSLERSPQEGAPRCEQEKGAWPRSEMCVFLARDLQIAIVTLEQLLSLRSCPRQMRTP